MNIEVFNSYCEDLTTDGFISFVNLQPKDRAITHRSTWQDCAVGDFVTEQFEGTSICDDEHMEASTVMAEELEEEEPDLHAILNESGIGEDWARHDIATYGGLQKFIKDHVL